jgi:hypothetical protein
MVLILDLLCVHFGGFEYKGKPYIFLCFAKQFSRLYFEGTAKELFCDYCVAIWNQDEKTFATVKRWPKSQFHILVPERHCSRFYRNKTYPLSRRECEKKCQKIIINCDEKYINVFFSLPLLSSYTIEMFIVNHFIYYGKLLDR